MRRALLLLAPIILSCRDINAADVTEALPPLPAPVAQLALVRDVPLSDSYVPTATFASLVGRDAVDVEVRDVRRSVVGQYTPGRVRVTVQVRVVNQLTRTVLVRPTFPQPPPGADQLLLFVARASAVEAPGGVSTTGNAVSIAVPGTGGVWASTDWDGAPWDFMRGVSCAAPAATCARFEPFAGPVPVGGTTEWRTVGFDVEPQVRGVRLHLVLAADLANPA